MKARKIVIAVGISAMAAFFSYKTYNEVKNKAEAKKLHDAAAAQAQEYLQSKYGFDAPMSDESEYPLRQKWLLEESVYEFSSEYDGRKFTVWVNTSDGDNIRCKDSYQFDDMCAEFKDMIEAEFSESFISDLWLGDNDEWKTGNALYGGFSDYYDGTNLVEMIKKNGKGSISVCVAESSLEDSDIDQRLSELNFTYSLTAFDTAEHLDEFQKFCESGQSYLNEFTEYKYAVPYITEHIDNLSGEKKKLAIDLKDCGAFKYAYLPVEIRGFPESEETSPPTKMDLGLFNMGFVWGGSDYNSAYDEREYIDTPVSDPWGFETRYGDVMVYYPLEKLKGNNIDDLRFAWRSYGGFANDRNIEKLTVFGDYAVLRLEFGDTRFMIVDMSGKDEYIPGWMKK